MALLFPRTHCRTGFPATSRLHSSLASPSQWAHDAATPHTPSLFSMLCEPGVAVVCALSPSTPQDGCVRGAPSCRLLEAGSEPLRIETLATLEFPDEHDEPEAHAWSPNGRAYAVACGASVSLFAVDGRRLRKICRVPLLYTPKDVAITEASDGSGADGLERVLVAVAGPGGVDVFGVLWEFPAADAPPLWARSSHRTLHSGYSFCAAAFSSCGRKLALGAMDGHLAIWRVRLTAEMVQLTSRGDGAPVTSIAPASPQPQSRGPRPTPAGAMAPLPATSAWRRGPPQAQDKGAHASAGGSDRVSASGEQTSRPRVGRVFSVADMMESRDQWVQLTDSARFTSASFSPDGRLLALGAWDGSVRIFRLATAFATGVARDADGESDKDTWALDGGFAMDASTKTVGTIPGAHVRWLRESAPERALQLLVVARWPPASAPCALEMYAVGADGLWAHAPSPQPVWKLPPATEVAWMEACVRGLCTVQLPASRAPFVGAVLYGFRDGRVGLALPPLRTRSGSPTARLLYSGPEGSVWLASPRQLRARCALLDGVRPNDSARHGTLATATLVVHWAGAGVGGGDALGGLCACDERVVNVPFLDDADFARVGGEEAPAGPSEAHSIVDEFGVRGLAMGGGRLLAWLPYLAAVHDGTADRWLHVGLPQDAVDCRLLGGGNLLAIVRASLSVAAVSLQADVSKAVDIAAESWRPLLPNNAREVDCRSLCIIHVCGGGSTFAVCARGADGRTFFVWSCNATNALDVSPPRVVRLPASLATTVQPVLVASANVLLLAPLCVGPPEASSPGDNDNAHGHVAAVIGHDVFKVLSAPQRAAPIDVASAHARTISALEALAGTLDAPSC